MEGGNRCGQLNMKFRGLKRSDAVDWWRLGCRNWPTPACEYNKPGSRQWWLEQNEEIKVMQWLKS